MSHHQRRSRRRPRSGPSVRDLLKDILDAIQAMDVPPDDGEEYKLFLKRLRRRKIVRDLHYPDYAKDWGAVVHGVFSSASTIASTGGIDVVAPPNNKRIAAAWGDSNGVVNVIGLVLVDSSPILIPVSSGSGVACVMSCYSHPGLVEGQILVKAPVGNPIGFAEFVLG